MTTDSVADDLTYSQFPDGILLKFCEDSARSIKTSYKHEETFKSMDKPGSWSSKIPLDLWLTAGRTDLVLATSSI